MLEPSSHGCMHSLGVSYLYPKIHYDKPSLSKCIQTCIEFYNGILTFIIIADLEENQTQREMARSCEPAHAGTAGGARRCRRQKLLETTDPDRRPLPGIRRKKSEKSEIWKRMQLFPRRLATSN